MNLDKETVEESKKLIAALQTEEAMDFTKPTEEAESEILKLWDSFEREKRLRHIKEAGGFYNQLEAAYVRQDSIRGSQMKREEAIKTKIRGLHQEYCDRWLHDLEEDVRDLLKKRRVLGEPDPERHIDRETGQPLFLISHNLQSTNVAIKKIQSSILKIRENFDRDSVDNLEKIFLSAHEAVNLKLKEEKILTSQENFNDLVNLTKVEIPKFTEMIMPEAVIEASVNKTVQALEGLRKEFV